jgi:hypothetical protein
VSIGGHQSAQMKNDEWLTPPDIIDALGPFDLDPCAPIERPWPTANKHLTRREDGLLSTRDGSVWLNPPYGREAERWLRRLANHGDGIALIFARTETEAFHEYVWSRADSLLFLRGRLHFHYVDGRRARSKYWRTIGPLSRMERRVRGDFVTAGYRVIMLRNDTRVE